MKVFYALAFVPLIYFVIRYSRGRANKKANFICAGAFALLVILGLATDPRGSVSFPYEVLDAKATGAVVLLEGDSLTKAALSLVADSLYHQSDYQLHKYGTNYRVMFYYRRDYRNHICYAYKAWVYDATKGGYSTDWDLSRYKSVDK